MTVGTVDHRTVVEEGDWLTVIGSSKGVRELRERYGSVE